MLPLLNFFKKHKSDAFFGVTFNSSSINLVLFKDGYPIHYVQENLTSGVVLDGRVVDKEHFVQSLNVCVERILSQLPEENPKEIFFGVGGNNCVGNTTTARQKLDPQEKIGKNILVGVYKEIEQNGLDGALEETYQTTGNRDAQLETILNETTSIKLDNQVVYNPLGQSGELLEIQVFNAYCVPTYIDALEDIARGLKMGLGGVFPLSYLLFKKLKSKLGANYDATHLSIHSDFTDISVVFGGNLAKNKTLPLGTTSLEKDLDFWMDGLELTFLEFSGVKTFANNVYVCGSGLERTDFWEMLEWREWEEKIPFKTKPIFTKLDAGFVDLPQEYKGDLLISGLLGICKELV
ncbi:MAG: hypothetical protein WC988_03425 [Patescibacteria group bacterium]